MTTNPASAVTDQVTATRAGQGAATWALGSLFEQLVAGDRTGGALAGTLVTQPPGLATPLHVHTREAEAWFVLDGTLTYRAGSEVLDLGPGDFIYPGPSSSSSNRRAIAVALRSRRTARTRCSS
jgi:quercetin dioxygenase-like cupin family protein